MSTTRTRRLARLWIAVACGCLFLLQAATAPAQTQPPPPSPKELWDAFPLDPQTTTPPATPAPPPASEPAPPVVPPSAPPTDTETDTGWGATVLAGGAAGALLILGAAAFLLRAARGDDARSVRRRAIADSGAVRPETTEQLIARAYAIAKDAAECDMLPANQPRKGVEAVSEIADRDLPAAQTTPGNSGSGGYAEIGERVASVLSAAEAAAEQIRADARLEAEELVRVAKGDAERTRQDAIGYESDTRAAVDSYASERRREAEQQVQKQLADAEAQARATREAAEQMARQIEQEGRQRGQALRQESQAVEERLKKALVGLRRMTTQLEELVGPPASGQKDGESLADALKPYGQGDRELQPIVEER